MRGTAEDLAQRHYSAREGRASTITNVTSRALSATIRA
jgi:hypothetical protein